MAIGPISTQLSGVVKSVFLPSTTPARLTNIFLAAAVFCKYALYPLSKYVFAKWESWNATQQLASEKRIAEYTNTCRAISNKEQDSITEELEAFLGELKEKNSIEKLRVLRGVIQETKNDSLVDATRYYFESHLKQFLSYNPSLFEEVVLTYCSSLCLLAETDRQTKLLDITGILSDYKNLPVRAKHSIYIALGMLYETPSEVTFPSSETVSFFNSAYLIVKNSSLSPSIKLELYLDVCKKYPYEDNNFIKKVCKEQNTILHENKHQVFSFIDTLDPNKQNHFLDNIDIVEDPTVAAYWELQNIKNTKDGADSLSEKIQLDKIGFVQNKPLLEKLHAFYTEQKKDDKASEIKKIIDDITTSSQEDKRKQNLARTSLMFLFGESHASSKLQLWD